MTLRLLTGSHGHPSILKLPRAGERVGLTGGVWPEVVTGCGAVPVWSYLDGPAAGETELIPASGSGLFMGDSVVGHLKLPPDAVRVIFTPR